MPLSDRQEEIKLLLFVVFSFMFGQERILFRITNREGDYFLYNSFGVHKCLGIPSTITGETSPWMSGFT